MHALFGRQLRMVAVSALIAIGMIVLAPPAISEGPKADDVGTAADQAIRDQDLQADKPVPEPDNPADLPKVPLQWLKYVVYALAACGIGFIIFTIVMNWRQSSAKWQKDSSEALEVASRVRPPNEGQKITDLDEIERLAARGAFSEAIHLLLLRAIGFLRSRLGQNWETSLTSREILGRVKLAGNGQKALGNLVAAVEISHFGGRPANEATYKLCLESYHLVTSIEAA